MPFCNIRIVRDVIADDPEGKKARISKAVTDAIRAEVGNKDVWIVFEEVAASDWYVGETSVATLRRQRK